MEGSQTPGGRSEPPRVAVAGVARRCLVVGDARCRPVSRGSGDPGEVPHGGDGDPFRQSMIVPAPNGARCLEVPADAPLWQEFRSAASPRWRRRDIPGSWATLAYMPRSQTPADRRTQATTGPAMASSVQLTTSTPHLPLSRLNHAACTLSVYASQPGSPPDHATLDSGRWPALTGQDSHLLGRVDGFRHVYPSTWHPPSPGFAWRNNRSRMRVRGRASPSPVQSAQDRTRRTQESLRARLHSNRCSRLLVREWLYGECRARRMACRSPMTHPTTFALSMNPMSESRSFEVRAVRHSP